MMIFLAAFVMVICLTAMILTTVERIVRMKHESAERIAEMIIQEINKIIGG